MHESYVRIYFTVHRDAVYARYNFSYLDCPFARNKVDECNIWEATYIKAISLNSFICIIHVLSMGGSAVIHAGTYRNNSERTPTFVHNYMRDAMNACAMCTLRYVDTILVRNTSLRALSQIRNWYTYRPAGVHLLNGITTRRQRHHAGRVDACSTFFTSNDFNGTNRFCGFAQVRKQRTTDKSLIIVTRPA